MALRVGVVGMRGIGNTHAQSHAKDPLSKLVAVCDVVKERADEAAKRYGVQAYYSLPGHDAQRGSGCRRCDDRRL